MFNSTIMKKRTQEVSVKKKTSILATNIEALGSSKDPCFGTQYDLTTEECKICGDSEICAIKFAATMGKTRKQLEAAEKYKDLESLIDKKAVFKSIRTLKRKGLKRPEIFDRVQAKYEITREDAKSLYNEYKETHKKS